MDEIRDKEILKGVIEGDQLAYKQLFLRYYSLIYRFLVKMLSDASQAEDIAQSIFMRIWIRREKLDPEGSIRNLLYVMAKNEALNLLHRKGLVSYEEELPQMITDISADSAVICDELQDSINRKIASMPAQRQKIFRLSRQEFLSNKEIAERLNLSVRTVEKHMELALKDIRGKIISGIVLLLYATGMF